MFFSLLLLGMVCASFMTTLAARSESIKCDSRAKLPEDIHKQYRDWLSDENGMHPSFQLLPEIYRQIGRKDSNADDTINDNNVSFLQGDRHCSKEMSINSSNIYDRSVCPWYFDLTYSENRYPSTMTTTRCRCNKSCYMYKDHNKKCRRMSSKCRNCSKETCREKCRKCKENILLPQCVEIPYRYKVLKQKYDIDGNKLCDDNGNFLYVKTYETVSVGCTCAIPKTDEITTYKRFVSEY